MVAPEDLQDIFKICAVGDKILDKGFQELSFKLGSLLKEISTFDKYFARFVHSLSQMFIRSCNVDTTIISLIVLMTPYLIELHSKPPYIVVPNEVKSLIPQRIASIFNL